MQAMVAAFKKKKVFLCVPTAGCVIQQFCFERKNKKTRHSEGKLIKIVVCLSLFMS